MTYKTEPGHRLYIKKRLAKQIEAEARARGLSMDDLILAKLSNKNSDNQIVTQLTKRTEIIENKLWRLSQLLETLLIDCGYVRGAIESQANAEATERAEKIEIRRSNLVSQIRQEIE